MFKTAIFDWDGTLSNTKKTVMDSFFKKKFWGKSVP